MPEKQHYLIGVISDTHGLLRPEIAEIFKGVDMILHAGDIDRPPVLAALKEIAPVIAVQGNMDRGEWTRGLPFTESAAAGSLSLYLIHNVYMLDLDPAAAGFRAVIHGHTHRPSVEEKNGVLFLNPGSAGPPRNHYPVSVALLYVRGTELDPRIVTLEE